MNSHRNLQEILSASPSFRRPQALYPAHHVRPVELHRIQGNQRHTGGLLSFPEYSSGHSTQSMVAATMLTALFGERAFADTTHLDHGLALEPRMFSSFEEAAAEAAMSRLYGGIHYPFGNENGLRWGACIGEVIFKRVQFKR
jgi:membrane-associated phospholipid phosphatase